MFSVKLPKEVLDLFPMWEYQCSKCGQIFDEPKHVCIKCGTSIDLMWNRVPPRFLKNHEAMSEYAHKVLAPKLTPDQRKLLFKHFTVLFSNGFEEGDFSAWTSTGGSPEVVETPVHHGDYVAYFDTQGDDVRKATTESSHYFYRVYVRFASLPTSGHSARFARCDHSGFLHQSGIKHDGTSVKWRMMYRYSSADNQHYSAQQPPSANIWYCVEGEVLCSTADGNLDGEYHTYVDGSELTDVAVTDVDTDYTSCYAVEVGFITGYLGGITIYIDCVVAADAYIGQEAVVETKEIMKQSDSRILRVQSLTKNSDAKVLGTQELSKPSDARIEATKELTRLSDATVFKTLEISKTSDSRILKTKELVKLSDADIRKTQEFTETSDSKIIVVETREIVKYSDCRIFKTKEVQKASGARVLQPRETAKLSDGHILKIQELSKPSDARIFGTQEFVKASDANVTKTWEQTKPSSSHILRIQEALKLSDARVLKVQQISKASDAAVIITNEVTKTSNSRIFKTQSFTKTSDSRIKVPFYITVEIEGWKSEIEVENLKTEIEILKSVMLGWQTEVKVDGLQTEVKVT